MPDELLTKEEIARELSDSPEPLSTRSVERYIQIAEVKPAVKGSGRGRQAKFRREDVERIKAAYREAAERREGQSSALATTRPAALQPAAAVGQLLDAQHKGFDELRAALDPWPMLLTREEAIARTGLPVTWFDAGVRKGLLAHVGEGRGRRFERDRVREFAARFGDAEFLKALLQKPDKHAASRVSRKARKGRKARRS